MHEEIHGTVSYFGLGLYPRHGACQANPLLLSCIPSMIEFLMIAMKHCALAYTSKAKNRLHS